MRKYLSITAAVISFQATLAMGVTTETIKHREYVYSYDDEARGLEEDVFLVCVDCPDSRLNPIYSVSVRYSQKPNRGGEATTANEPVVVEVPASLPAAEPPERKILGIIRFPFDSYVLSSSLKRKLNGLGLGNRRVRLEGYTCTIGPKNYNETLSLRRAESVSKYLKSRGVSILNAVGCGESRKFKDKAPNRRVEIIEDVKE